MKSKKQSKIIHYKKRRKRNCYLDINQKQKAEKLSSLTCRFVKKPTLFSKDNSRSRSTFQKLRLNLDTSSITPQSLQRVRNVKTPHTTTSQRKIVLQGQTPANKGTKLNKNVMPFISKWQEKIDEYNNEDKSKYQQLKEIIIDRDGHYCFTQTVQDDYDLKLLEQLKVDHSHTLLNKKYRKIQTQVVEKILKASEAEHKFEKEGVQQPLKKYIKSIKKNQQSKFIGKYGQRILRRVQQQTQNELQKLKLQTVATLETQSSKHEEFQEMIRIKDNQIGQLKRQLKQLRMENLLEQNENKRLDDSNKALQLENYKFQQFKHIYSQVEKFFSDEQMKPELIMQILDQYTEQKNELIKLNDTVVNKTQDINEINRKYKAQMNNKDDLIVQIRDQDELYVKEIKSLKKKIVKLERKLEEKHLYEEKYNHLFKKLMDQYGKWAKLNPLFSKNIYSSVKQGEEKFDIKILPNFDRVDHIFEQMNHIIKISTPYKCQVYLRKIIVYANQIQRKYFPEHVNECYSPEKVYQRVFNKIQRMDDKIILLDNQNRQLKAKVAELENKILINHICTKNKGKYKKASMANLKLKTVMKWKSVLQNMGKAGNCMQPPEEEEVGYTEQPKSQFIERFDEINFK